uniref:HMA domain-containing protein n=1 Tax=Ganoderma boninense TaxID=34458 RepID=A0A5K1JWU5_9APHY|nr:Uncharacterized protein [Ganoderma boninense]
MAATIPVSARAREKARPVLLYPRATLRLIRLPKDPPPFLPPQPQPCQAAAVTPGPIPSLAKWTNTLTLPLARITRTTSTRRQSLTQVAARVALVVAMIHASISLLGSFVPMTNPIFMAERVVTVVSLQTLATSWPGIETSQASISECTCCEEHEEKDKLKDGGDAATSAQPPPVKSCEHSGLRKRSPKSSSTNSIPKEACGEHRNIARSRYNDTLAAFGCVCKALLARGRKSCCTHPTLTGKAVARPVSSRHSVKLNAPKRKSLDSCCSPSVDSCCGNSACGKEAPSIRSIPHSHRKEGGSIRSRSCASLDSCCDDSCCGGGGVEKKNEDAAIDIAERGAVTYNEHAVLAIKGMTCTGCENKLIRTLRDIPTIGNAKTSLVLCRAEFDFDNGATDISALIQLIEKRSGFTAEAVREVQGSTHDLPLAVSQVLHEQLLAADRPNGVKGVVREGKDTVVVAYDPNVIGARDILKAYKAFSPVLAPEPPDPAILAGAKHIRLLFIRTAISAALTIPVLIMTWAPLPPHAHVYSIASLVLATIVQVGITGPFYTASFKSLVFSRLVETDLLIVLSTTTAYIYSVVAFAFEMIGRPLATGQFFETSTLLVTLIMVGRVISAVARQRAIEAISIRSLQEKTARIVFSDKSEQVLDVRLLHFGDTFKVLPDSAIITDGAVVSGASTVDESMMTGESLPVEKALGTRSSQARSTGRAFFW